MLVEFQRTGDRRYAVSVTGTQFPDLEMNPAPGYDPFLPHDILHLVAEACLDLKQGIFGQLAAGGHAGTFHIKAGTHHNSREESRAWRRIKKRGIRLAQLGAYDSAKSEQVAYLCWQEWLSRSDSKLHQKQAQSMKEQAQNAWEAMSEEESECYGAAMDDICRHLGAISTQWHACRVGESIQIRWPDLNISVNRLLSDAD